MKAFFSLLHEQVKEFLSKCTVLKVDLLYDHQIYCLRACMCALFSPEILQGVAMKGLKSAHYYYKASLTRQIHQLASLSYNRLNSTASVYLTELLTVHKPATLFF